MVEIPAFVRQKLEAILHPRIRALWRDQVASWGAESRPLAVVVIPLLFETNAQAELDKYVRPINEQAGAVAYSLQGFTRQIVWPWYEDKWKLSTPITEL